MCFFEPPPPVVVGGPKRRSFNEQTQSPDDEQPCSPKGRVASVRRPRRRTAPSVTEQSRRRRRHAAPCGTDGVTTITLAPRPSADTAVIPPYAAPRELFRSRQEHQSGGVAVVPCVSPWLSGKVRRSERSDRDC